MCSTSCNHMIWTFLPYTILILSFMTTGIIMVLSSNNWLFLWIGLELNLLSFIPLISASSRNQETEASVKYFLVQAVSSGLLLFTITALKPDRLVMQTLLLIGLSIKAGMAPCYFWFPQVIASIDWLICFFLSTIQKFNPLFLLFSLVFGWAPLLILVICSTNRLVGGLGGLNQRQIRPLLSYSSIGHISWIVTSRTFMLSLRLCYFLVYLIITRSIILTIINITKTTTGQFNMTFQTPSGLSLFIILSFLSLAGLPPLLGFFPKWIVVSLLFQTSPLLRSILIIGSMVTLFYYLLVFFSSNVNTLKRVTLTFASQTQSLTSGLAILSLWLIFIILSALVILNKP